MTAKENANLPLQNLCCEALEPVDQGENLMALIKQLIKEKEYEGVALLFTSAGEASKNVACLPQIAIDLYHDVCLKHLNQETYERDAPLYSCAEELLKTLSAYTASPEELLLELLELIEEAKSDQVFTSALRALQVVLIRQGNLKPRALEWSLNSIIVRRQTLPVLSHLEEGYDEEQEALLEQDEETQNLLMFYITVGLFYDPLIDNICAQPRPEKELIFRSCDFNRRNVMCCFLLELLGKPLALLDLSNSDSKKTNTYSLQCARSLTRGITKCLVDPMFLLGFVEMKVRWKSRINEPKELHKRSVCNIFLIDDKLSLDCLAIYYYMIIVEGVDAAQIPLIYHPLYVNEMGLYLVQELLSTTHPALHDKALKLASKLLTNLGQTWKISSSDLDLEIHKTLCNSLCNLLTYSPLTHLRQMGVKVLKQYIISFDHEGKYLILKNLMRTVQHHGIRGYLATVYKDLVAEALLSSSPLPTSFSGTDFRSIFLQNICKLERGVETDLIDNSDQIISSLNALRFFAIKDADNRTGFWSFVKDVDVQFVEPLRKALNLSEAHYKAELHNVHEGRDMTSMQNLNILDISIPNDKVGGGGNLDLQLDRDKKIELLNQNLCTFELIRSLLGRVCEFLYQQPQPRSQSANDISANMTPIKS